MSNPLPWNAYWRLIRGDKPIGTLLLLWPTLVALFFAAQGQPPAWPLAVFVLGTFLMRSAGCAINDWADRDIDRHVWRTANRPLACGEIPPRQALFVAAALAMLAALLAATLGLKVLWWSVPAVLIAAAYPFTKRFFPMPQAVLGVAFSFGIPMAYVAVRGELAPEVLWLFLGNLAWVIAYDTAYAMADRPDDLKLGIHTSALLFGRWDVTAIALLELAALACWAIAGKIASIGAPYFLVLIAVAAFFAWQFPQLARRDPKECFQAFLDQQWAGLLWFLGTVWGWAVR